MASNLRLVSSRLTKPRPLPTLNPTGILFNTTSDKKDEAKIIPNDPPATYNEVLKNQADNGPRNYDAITANEERFLQELAEESSVSLRELPSHNGTLGDEPSIVPLGDIVDATPRETNEERIAVLYESLRKRNITAPVKKEASNRAIDTYFERSGYFTRKRQNQLQKNDDRASISAKYRDAGVAYSVQRMFHNFALIVQGYLSGLSLGKVVFAIYFANEKILLETYQAFSLPVHVAFAIAYTIACVAAYDRVGIYTFNWQGFVKTLSHGGFLGAFLWTAALISSLACMSFDQDLSNKRSELALTPGALLLWRISCGVQAVCAGAAWLLLALKPEGDELGDAIHRTVDMEIESEKEAKQQHQVPDATQPIHGSNASQEGPQQ